MKQINKAYRFIKIDKYESSVNSYHSVQIWLFAVWKMIFNITVMLTLQ